MSKWKNVKTYLEVNPYTGQPVEEDAPTNSAGSGAVAGIGVGPDGEPGFDPKKKKKKTLIDARSKSYKEHRMRLEKARQRREEIKAQERAAALQKQIADSVSEGKSMQQSYEDHFSNMGYSSPAERAADTPTGTLGRI